MSLKKIIIEKELLKTEPFVQYLYDRASSLTETEITDDVTGWIADRRSGQELFDRENLLVHRNKGSFISSCPGSDGMVCCNYFVINTGPGCVYDCHYCFLQSYMNTPVMSLYGNMNDLIQELDFKTRNKKVRFRIGTGEYTDSLALEPYLGYSEFLIRHISGKENMVLELKTKSANVESLLDLDHRGNTIIAWSLNTPFIIKTIEDGTADLEERLGAAKKAAGAGYPVAFHFDPVFFYEGWEEEYHSLIDRLFTEFSSKEIRWISMGGFRYSPDLYDIIVRRFPGDLTLKGEMIQGTDGKYRYFKTIREKIYTSLRDRIRSHDPDVFLYMCMDTGHMWRRIEGRVWESSRTFDSAFWE